MGRPRTFLESDVIASATEVFTTSGYEGSSVDELVTATGMARASLYGVFGSKHGLFLRCLAAADALEPRASLDLLLVALLERARTDAKVRGCCRQLLATLPTDSSAILGARLLERAGLAADSEHRTG